ncbi:hypothetical protein Q5M85_18980 [Paraclostridium bifermentans]|nr:hypothetical protein [Paraclostridium bifermentans]
MNKLKKFQKEQIELKLQGKIKNEKNLLFFDKNENPIAQDVLSKNLADF